MYVYIYIYMLFYLGQYS